MIVILPNGLAKQFWVGEPLEDISYISYLQGLIEKEKQ